MTMRPPVIGRQEHNSVLWDRVALGLVSAMQWLKSIEEVTGVAQPDMHAKLLAAREIASANRARGQRLLEELAIEDPEMSRRCHAGLEPWPDEDALTFTGRCNCQDQCFHRFEGDLDDDRYRRLVESPLFECKCDGIRPPCPVPGHPLEDA